MALLERARCERKEGKGAEKTPFPLFHGRKMCYTKS